MSENKKFINILFDIFGYSFVGILAYAFGLILQYYNYTKGFDSLANYNINNFEIIFIIFLHILLILLFGHAYATVILIDDTYSTVYNKVCNTIGHWLETIFITVIVFFLMFHISFPENLSFNFWITNITSIVIFTINLFVYRIKIKRNSEYKKTVKYALICPTILMIGVNIYSGASLFGFLKLQLVSFLPMILFAVCFLLIYLASAKKTTAIYCLYWL